MNKHLLRTGVLALACILVSSCQDRREPVKPSVDLSAGIQVQAAAV